MNNVDLLHKVMATILFGIAVVLFLYNVRISFYLWRESVSGSMPLALDKKLPLRSGLSMGLAIVLIIVGLIVLAPGAIELLDEGFIIACVIGIFTAINIAIRQRAAKSLASKSGNHPTSDDKS